MYAIRSYYDAETGHLRSGTSGGVDGQVGRHGLGGFIHALEVMDLAAVGNNQTNTFTAVMGGTAAQGDQGVTAFFP